MRKIDKFVLNILHNISNWTYEKFGVNNYTIATIILTLAVIASTFAAIETSKLAETDIDPRMAMARKGASLFAGIFFVGLALLFIRYQKNLGEFLSRKYDLEKTKSLFSTGTIFFRWYFILMYPLSFLLGNKWWGMFDTLLLGIALLFLSCEPPKMEIRMSKVFKE